ncbi:hypothetical protein EDC04DRAFT_158510 [Pisolithus marmoratus]|nr:hypothetical protein EDC04DRAFT_158510 [Pisolithus marmoratus]
MSDQFNSEVRVGMIFNVVASSMSALAVGGVLLYIAYSAITIQRNASRRWSTDTHIHYYFLNLMIFDLIQAVGGLMSTKWIAEVKVYSSPFCTVQGILSFPFLDACHSFHAGLLTHVGDVGVALSTMAIALQILQVLVLRRESPPKFALLILAIVWLAILVLVVVPNVVQHNIYGPTGYWCWIDRNTVERIGLDYLWMWLAAVLDIISYLSLALVMRRCALADGNKLRWWGKQESRSILDGLETSAESVRVVQMLFYPLVYVIIVLPISAARFSQFRGHDVPLAVTTFTDTLFALSGLFDTILYAFTRPRMIRRRPLHDPRSTLPAHVPAARMAHDCFPQDYMIEDGNFTMEKVRIP